MAGCVNNESPAGRTFGPLTLALSRGVGRRVGAGYPCHAGAQRRSKASSIIVALAALAAVLPGPASASSISFSGDLLTYNAAAGEQNVLELRTGVESIECGSRPAPCFVIHEQLDPGEVASFPAARCSRNVAADVACDVPSSVIVNLGDEDDEVGDWDGPSQINGGPGNDGANGRGGNDTLRGGTGDDELLGDYDNDRLFGEAGEDRLWGGPDDDELDGGPGIDVFDGDRRMDFCLACGSGTDRILARDGHAEHVRCGGGEDTAIVDPSDRTAPDCEQVDRGGAPPPPSPPLLRPPPPAAPALSKVDPYVRCRRLKGRKRTTCVRKLKALKRCNNRKGKEKRKCIRRVNRRFSGSRRR